MPQIYDMGPTALLPSEGRRAEDFFALKNPTASAAFEPVNLGTKGQHATPRPPKPLSGLLRSVEEFLNRVTFEDGTDMLSRNVANKLRINVA
jgi:hypothetical protein